MLDEFFAKLRTAGTTNDLQRLYLDAEQWLTPAQLDKMSALAFTFDPVIRKWVDALVRITGPIDQEARRFTIRRLDWAAHLYEDADIPRSEKVLVIAFSTVVGRLFFPVPVVLSFLPSSRLDVVVLRDPQRHYFLCGLGALGDDFVAMHRWMESALALGSYRRVVALGMSMGGLAAFRTALFLNLDRGVSIGGRFHWPVRRLLSPEARKPEAFDMLCRCYSEKAVRLIGVYPSQNREDAATAQRLSQFLNIEWITVEGDQHNVLLTKLKKGVLREFLADILGIDRPPGSPAAGPEGENA